MERKILELKEKGAEFAVCTVVHIAGSSPARVGMKMIVMADGSQKGSVGGGNLEHTTIEKAINQIKKGESILVDNALNDLNMTCGGSAKIYIEVYKSLNRVVVIGVGHIGEEILKIISSSTEFDAIGFDNRKERSEELGKKYNIKYLEDYTDVYKYLRANDFVVVMTHGHEFDSQVVKSVSKVETKYIGCIGSKNKVKTMFEYLKENGVSQEYINRVHSPIGIKIGGDSIFDIAVSIIAEVVSVKNMGEVKCSNKL